MERTQFTFYESFAKAVGRIKRPADRARAYDAIVDYALYGREPDMDALPDAVAIALELIRPTLDSSRRKAESGKAGGKKKQAKSKGKEKASQKQTKSKMEAKSKQGEGGSKKENKIEKEKKNEIEKENEDECPPPIPPSPSSAVADYLNRVNPSASQRSLFELAGYEQSMGPDVCRRAIDIALDNRKPSWAYIKAILQRWSASGVKCIADIEALEFQHEAQKRTGGKYKPGAGATAPQPGIPGEADRRAREDMERLRKQLRGGAL